MVEDLCRAGVGRLHPEQQAADAFDLTKGTEYRVAELQLYPQALVNRPLQQLGEQAASGLVGRWHWAEQQQGMFTARYFGMLPAVVGQGG
ncbi:hypothetical protein D3C76_1550220 [compost metagenome]